MTDQGIDDIEFRLKQALLSLRGLRGGQFDRNITNDILEEMWRVQRGINTLLGLPAPGSEKLDDTIC